MKKFIVLCACTFLTAFSYADEVKTTDVPADEPEQCELSWVCLNKEDYMAMIGEVPAEENNVAVLDGGCGCEDGECSPKE